MPATEEDKSDISGMFYDWTSTDTGTIKGCAGGNHYVGAYSLLAGGLVIEEEAYVEYDSNGSETYFVHSDTHDAGGDENGQVSDSTKLDKMFDEFMNGEVIELSVVE